jgi:hypothetical protein
MIKIENADNELDDQIILLRSAREKNIYEVKLMLTTILCQINIIQSEFAHNADYYYKSDALLKSLQNTICNSESAIVTLNTISEMNGHLKQLIYGE